MSQKSILPLEVDEKMAHLGEALDGSGVALELPLRRSPRSLFQHLLERIFDGSAPDALLVRYLNSPKRLGPAVSWWLFTAMTVLVGRFSGVSVLWLVHNVDRETIQPYRGLTRSLRWLIAMASSSILVTDPLLVPVAKRYLPERVAHKLDWITFGERETSIDSFIESLGADDTGELIELLQQLRQRCPEALIGFCPTSSGAKCVHLQHAPTLISAGMNAGIPVHLVIVGAIGDSVNFGHLSEVQPSLARNIHVIPRRITYDPRRVSAHVDFYWRSLSDQSVSYTLYEAAGVGLPVLTMKCGFLGRAVPEYRLGACLEMDFSNLCDAIGEIRGWERENARAFLRTHSWSVAAERISKLV